MGSTPTASTNGTANRKVTRRSREAKRFHATWSEGSCAVRELYAKQRLSSLLFTEAGVIGHL